MIDQGVAASEPQDQYILGLRRDQAHMQYLCLWQAQGGDTFPLDLHPSPDMLRKTHQHSFGNNAFNAGILGNNAVGDFPYLENLTCNLWAKFVQPCLNFGDSVKLRHEAVNISVIEGVHCSSPYLHIQSIANLRYTQEVIL